MRHIVAICLTTALFLSACASEKSAGVDFTCPEVGFVKGTDKTRIGDVNVAIAGLSGECAPVKKSSNKVEVLLTVPFTASLPASGAADTSKVKAEYFVATLGEGETLLQRQVFVTALEFDDTGAGASEEQHRIELPVPSVDQAHRYRIAVGFIANETSEE